MIGKRVIMIKRPAVLCAAAFVTGVITARYSGWTVGGIAAGVSILYGLFLRNLRKGRRRIPVADRLLILVPVFLLFGYGMMRWEQSAYEKNVAAFSACMVEGREVLAEGKVSHIRWTENGVRLELADAEVTSYNGEGTEYNSVGNLLVYADDLRTEKGEIKHGQRLLVYGNGSIFERAPNPGGFDANTYYFSLGITGAIQGKSLRITDFSYHRLNQALFQAKNKLIKSYITYLGEDGAGVILSMLLGERALLSEETQELYRRGGISHILAISGLHVSMIGTALYEWLRKTALGRNGAIPVACAGVLLYGSFVEAGTSTKRAVIMFLLLLAATALGRTYDTLSAMSVSVIVILCESPGALYTASFQLSFAAAYGASVLAAMLRERREETRLSGRKGTGGVTTGDGIAVPEAVETAKKVALRCNNRWIRIREYIGEKVHNMFVFGLAIQAVSFPFTVYHFFEYPTYGLLLNPLVVPLMTILLLCGMLSGICGLLVPWLGDFFAGGTRGILWIYDALCRLTEQLPGSLLLVGRPEVWQMAVYYVLLVGCLYVWYGRGRKRLRRTEVGEKGLLGKTERIMRSGAEQLLMRLEQKRVVLLLMVFLPFVLLPIPCGRLEAAFLDVGQGDGIVLRGHGGSVFLVDGGSTSVQKVGEKRIIPYLKAKGIRIIDCAFVSHTDSDHMNGVKEILAAMPVYSKYRESIPGYTGTPVIKRLVLPEWYEEKESLIGNIEEEPVKRVLEGEVDKAYSELVKLAEEKLVEVCYMGDGDRMTLGTELVLSCLAPEEDVVYDNKNAASMVLLATYGEFDLLLTGDMEKEGEIRLLKSGIPASDTVEVLKVSHHGSYTASSETFISALQPRISVISCGKNNRYGHPHTETLNTLYGANSRVYRTDESGCVTVKVRKKKMVVEEFSK